MRVVCQKIFLATIRLSIAATLSASANETVFAQGGQKPVRPIQAPLAEQDDGVGPVVHNPASPNLAGRYFVDFRARTAATYGHAFVWYGQLTSQGKIGMVEVAGLHPATDSPVPYIIGHVFPVPSETGKSYGDLDEQYLTASYRVYLSEADAKKVFAYIKHKQETSPVWIAGMINCTSFVADIASYMGLKTPLTGTWMYPEDLVNSIRDLNKGRHEISLATAND
jgi:hypothetical protein